jgi:hypothetical protein
MFIKTAALFDKTVHKGDGSVCVVLCGFCVNKKKTGDFLAISTKRSIFASRL